MCYRLKIFRKCYANFFSYNGFKYYVIFIDDFSRATWIYLMKNKSEVFFHFQNFVNFIETQYNKKIKILRTDNGTEFINQNLILEGNTIGSEQRRRLLREQGDR